jgi:phasin
MNETIIGTKASTAKHISDPFGISKYQIPKMELPAELHEMAEKGVAHVRETCAKAKVASEEAGDLLEEVYTTAAKGALDYNLKIIDFGRANARAAFDYAYALLGVKSPSQFIELSTTHMRKQFDIASAQNKELYALAQEMAAETAAPIKTSMSKTFNKAT